MATVERFDPTKVEAPVSGKASALERFREEQPASPLRKRDVYVGALVGAAVVFVLPMSLARSLWIQELVQEGSARAILLIICAGLTGLGLYLQRSRRPGLGTGLIVGEALVGSLLIFVVLPLMEFLGMLLSWPAASWK